jgi:iron complex transport system permease protein
MGGVLLLAADYVSQRLFGDLQLPVGVVTGVCGGLYLIWLLHREWHRGTG